jgi:uncharacterized protein (DUF1800 family)
MASDPKADAALALHRFGFGPRNGSIAAIASDPRGAVLAELDRPGAGQIDNPDLPASGVAARAAFAFQQAQNAARQAARVAQQQQQNAGANQAEQPMSIPGQTPGPAAATNAPRPQPVPQQLYLDDAKARIQAALAAEIGVVDRLVWFWSNHFCVSADKGGVRPIAGAFEREAIRAHVRGRFGDMLLAVEQHPAMLIYLDNTRSIGPNSVAGVRQKRGLNENLAREILELHTLGVRSVYTQDDVTSFANVITGWTIAPLRQDAAHGGEFTFTANMHQPGAHTVIGKSYAEAGVEQGRAVLATLARHPATAKHIATKLARHFIADEPPPALVERLSKRFLDTQGDLKELAKALVNSPEAWSAPRTKLKRPSEWIVAALRAVETDLPRNADPKAQALGAFNRQPPEIGPVMQAQNLLGEPLWRPSAPKGFADESGPWLDGLAQRLDIANQLARRVAGTADPKAVAEEVLGPLASAETRQAIARAESRPQALALLLMSPEFQRR